MNLTRVLANVASVWRAAVDPFRGRPDDGIGGARYGSRGGRRQLGADCRGARDLVPAERSRGAVRFALPPQAVTNDDGVYVFDGIAAGRYRVQAQKTGFVTSNLATPHWSM